MAKENPVFVVGVYRSGTTPLCDLLNQNPEIALMYECDVWNFPRALLKSRFKFNWTERLEFYNKPLSRHWRMTPDDVERLEKVRTPMDLYRAFAEQKGASIVGEKCPTYSHRLEQLYQQFPNASFIILWRDPVEVYRSVVKAAETSRFFAKPGMLSRTIYLQEQVIRQAARIEKNGARVFHLDYADLIGQTEQVYRKLCEFLSVPFDAERLHPDEDNTKERHHGYMWYGIVLREESAQAPVPTSVAEKLTRYRNLWQSDKAAGIKPGRGATHLRPLPFEYFYHNAMGKALIEYDSLVRACFEFLPLSWLRNYRRLKAWIFAPAAARPPVPAVPAARPQPPNIRAREIATEIVAD